MKTYKGPKWGAVDRKLGIPEALVPMEAEVIDPSKRPLVSIATSLALATVVAVLLAAGPSAAQDTDGTASSENLTYRREPIEAGHGILNVEIGAMDNGGEVPQGGFIEVGVDGDGAIKFWKVEINALRFSLFCMGSTPDDGLGQVTVGPQALPLNVYSGECRLSDYLRATEERSGLFEVDLQPHRLLCRQPLGCESMPEEASPFVEGTTIQAYGWAPTRHSDGPGVRLSEVDPARLAAGTLLGCQDSHAQIAVTGCGRADGEAVAVATNGGRAESNFAAIAVNGSADCSDWRWWDPPTEIGPEFGRPTTVLDTGSACITAPIPGT